MPWPETRRGSSPKSRDAPSRVEDGALFVLKGNRMEDTLAQDIREQLVDAIDPAPQQEAMVIDSLERLQWYLSKLQSISDRIEAHENVAKRQLSKLNEIVGIERDRIQSEFLAATSELRASLKFLSMKYGHQAYLFSREHMKTLPKKTKSFKLGSSQIGTRKEPDKFVIKDKEAVIDWAIGNQLDGELLNYETNIKVAALNEYLSNNPGILDSDEAPAVSKVEGETNFYAKIKGVDIMTMTETDWTKEEANEPEGNDILEG